MKKLVRALFFIVIIGSAVVSIRYAAALYQTKYAPRYLNGSL